MNKEYTLQEIKELVENDKTKHIGMLNQMFLESCIDYLEMSDEFLNSKFGIRVKFIKG